MNVHTPIFGTEATFEELAERIRGFSHDDASVTEQGNMITACKLLAEETTLRWENVRRIEEELKSKLSMAQLREQMNDVLGIMPAPKKFLNWSWPR
jgi:hypothetical protein